jgi:hypothetical protein
MACCILFLIGTCISSSDAGSRSFKGLPGWVTAIYQQQSLDRSFLFSDRRSPQHFNGDFDGDGKEDFATIVEQRDSRKLSLAIFNAGSGKVFLIGGTTPVLAQRQGSAKELRNIDWIVSWSSGTWEGPAPEFKPTGVLFLLDEEQSGSVVSWNGSRYISELFETGND